MTRPSELVTPSFASRARVTLGAMPGSERSRGVVKALGRFPDLPGTGHDTLCGAVIWDHGAMLAALADGPGAVIVRDVTQPLGEDGRAVVRVSQAGICATDHKIIDGDIQVTGPWVLGHEMTGHVEIPGRGGIPRAGTAVMINPAVFCGICDLCRRDMPHLCRRGGLLGRDADGCF